MPTNSIVLSDSPNLKIQKVTLDYDRGNAHEVYAAIIEFFGQDTAISELSTDTISKFINEGACPVWWLRALKNHQHGLSKPAKRKRTRCNQPRKRANYARLVLSKEMVA